MNSPKEIGNWYNSFSKKQLKTGINLRHYRIMDYLIESGLQKNSNVLEVGCGIGTLTSLLCKYVSSGTIDATDISSDSVKILKKNLYRYKQLKASALDILNLKSSKKYDFIILPDVLEHIPIHKHQELFHLFSKHMNQESVICINIPHPKALDFIRETNPDKLQIVDQSLNAQDLLNNVYSNGLILVDYISYPLFSNENDYVFISFKKNTKVTLTKLPKSKIIFKKILVRLKFFFSRL
tara:strand:+ start:37664 stop:38377 length:714 start_codon:yes stop_codon:yes gene_type:complete